MLLDGLFSLRPRCERTDMPEACRPTYMGVRLPQPERFPHLRASSRRRCADSHGTLARCPVCIDQSPRHSPAPLRAGPGRHVQRRSIPTRGFLRSSDRGVNRRASAPASNLPRGDSSMNTRFELAGPLTELSSYPQWAQEMVAECDRVKQTVVDHELWDMMRNCALDIASTTNFMAGIWPVIERFPAYMAQSLLKTRFGRSDGDNLARRWLVRNIRVEQNHAEYWLNWAEGAGVPREAV